MIAEEIFENYFPEFSILVNLPKVRVHFSKEVFIPLYTGGSLFSTNAIVFSVNDTLLQERNYVVHPTKFYLFNNLLTFRGFNVTGNS